MFDELREQIFERFRWIGMLPSIILLVVFCGLVGRGFLSSGRIISDYRVSARKAFANGDSENAKFYYSRLIGRGERGSSEDQLTWVRMLIQTGDQREAKRLLDDLAPTDSIGYAPAHRIKAQSLAAQMQQIENIPSPLLKELKWHLQHGARDVTPQSDVLWAQYYVAVKQYDQAINRLENAAVANPQLWRLAAELHNRIGQVKESERAIARYVGVARERIETDPFELGERVQLAAVLVQQKKYREAEILVRKGLAMDAKHPGLLRFMSELVLLRLKNISEANEGSSTDQPKRLAILSEAYQLDPSNPSLFKAMRSWLDGANTPKERSILMKQLEGWIAEGKSGPMAHFLMGNVAWQDGNQDDALFHFEAALKMDEKLAVVANNLAWVLTKADQPDLERAEEFARLAMKANPDNVSFNDTLANVLLAQKRYDEALVQMEKVLPLSGGAKRQTIHEQLAEIYENLGRESLAATHRRLAAEPTETLVP